MGKRGTKSGGRQQRRDNRPVYGPSVGKVVAKKLNERGWTQGQLAIAVGVTQATISQLIAGETLRPSPLLLRALAAAFNMTVEELAPGVTLLVVSGAETESRSTDLWKAIVALQAQLDYWTAEAMKLHPELRPPSAAQLTAIRKRIERRSA